MIHPRRHFMPDELALLRRHQQRHRIRRVVAGAIEPAREVVGPDGDGHARMQHREVGACGRGHDRDRVEFLAVRPDPGLGKTGESEQAAIAAIDEQRPLAPRHRLPFVIAVGRNETAATPHRVLECRLVLNRLRAGVDHQRDFTGILDPGRDQPPAHQPEVPRTSIEDHDRYRLGRGDIVPRREIWLLGIAENLSNCRRGRGNDEASAHSEAKVGGCSVPFNPHC